MAFNRVLVANRGEIARRIVRACREAGLTSVAVHTPLDARALHVAEADDAVLIESYLDADEIVAAARASGADAVHPGYGFLSENAGFARAVTAAGLRFVGPSADVIELMGRKDRAREVAERAGVPVTPQFTIGADGVAEVPDDAYPVLVKAAAGGGGKGMHVVRSADQLPEALATARREARSAFGDDALLVEAYVEGGRHVEVQVFGDEHGHVVHLFERDCSAQRRHQKVVEEAPAPGLAPGLRALLLESSVALAREVGYVGAGTVEFLVLGDQGYFLEMNTRLQVEHPVTEQVTGLDLVQWQLDVAAGRPLPRQQEDITCTGHAVEVRVYAEDPYAGFVPQAGQVLDAHWPDRPGHVHAAIEGPSEVSPAYDPMIAKLVGRGEDREAAIADVLGIIDASAVVGTETNLGWVRRLVASAEFGSGEVHTGWLDAHDGLLLQRPTLAEEALQGAARHLFGAADSSPFGRGDGWRSAGPASRPVGHVLDADGTVHEVSVDPEAPDVLVHVDGARRWVTWQGRTVALEAADAMRRGAAAVAGEADVVAPMPGTVVALDVAEGDVVLAGQRLAAVEAMKMELTLTAPHDGIVTHVGGAVGDQVGMGHVLVHVSEHA